jgi:DNA gyrase subunit A
VITIKTGGRNGDVVAVRKVNATDELMITSKHGKILRIKVADIRVTGRNAMGVKVMNLHEGDLVMALEPVVGGTAEEPKQDTKEQQDVKEQPQDAKEPQQDTKEEQ